MRIEPNSNLDPFRQLQVALDTVRGVAGNLIGTNNGHGDPAELPKARKDQVSGFQEERSGNGLAQALAQIAPGKAQVSEEDLYAALIVDRLERLQGPEVAHSYLREFEAAKLALQRPGGYVPVEEAAVHALQKLVDSGLISKEAAEAINAQAFQGAQLDDRLDVLYDDRGSDSDPTRAVAAAADALLKAQRSLDRMGMGRESAGRRRLKVSNGRASGHSGGRTEPVGGKIDGADGFLFKPRSDGDGRLVILLPREMTRDVASVTLRDASGRVVDTGQSRGVANGGREHFRFGKEGGAYPPDLTVEVKLRDGSTKQYSIPDPAKRYD